MPDHPTPSTPPFRVSGPDSPPHPSPPTQPIYEMSVANSRALDHRATTDFGIPSILLMENAAIAIANHALDLLKSARSQSILIAAGPGNNAGDAFAAARHLATLGCPPTIVMTTPAEHITADAKINLDIITKMNIPTIDAQTYLESAPPQPGLIIDALFGTGLTRPIEGIAQQLITHINAARASGTLVLAVDVPSGLNAQTGEPMGDAAIQADRTLTFAALKDGYRNFNAQPHLGEVHIAPLAIPTQLLKSLGTQIHPPQDRPQ